MLSSHNTVNSQTFFQKSQSGKSAKKKSNWQEKTPNQSYQRIWLFKGVTRSRQLRKGDNLTKSAKSVKYHPKRPLLMQKLKNCYLLVPRLLVVSTSGATSIPKEAKLTNAHSSSTCINCLGVVASFATKIKES